MPFGNSHPTKISQLLESSDEREYFQHLTSLLNVAGTWVLRKLFNKICPESCFQGLLGEYRQDPYKFRKAIPPYFLKIIFEENNKGYTEYFDLSVLCFLLTAGHLKRFFRGSYDAITDAAVVKDIKTLRSFRNSFAHNVTQEIGENVFLTLWEEISEILKRLAYVTGGDQMKLEVESAIDIFHQGKIDRSRLLSVTERFKDLDAKIKIELERRLDPVVEDVRSLKESVKKLEKDIGTVKGEGI